MRLILTSATAALAIATAACNSNKVDENTSTAEGNVATNDLVANDAMTSTDTAVPMAAAGFANTVAASDTYEIESSKLAADKASSGDVKSLAAMLVTDHQKSTVDLKAAAAKSKPAVTPDPSLTADQQADIDALKSAGASFDQVYVSQQLAAHQKALSALKSYATGGDDDSLKEFAAKASGVVQTHLDKLNGMKK